MQWHLQLRGSVQLLPRGESLLLLRGVNGLYISPCLPANEAVRRVLHSVVRKIFLSIDREMRTVTVAVFFHIRPAEFEAEHCSIEDHKQEKISYEKRKRSTQEFDDRIQTC